MSKVEKAFEYELSLIKSERLKAFVIKCYKYCPESYWVLPTSTTKKYHPSFVNKEGGIIVHVKYAIWWAQKLIRAFPDLHPEASDEIISALLLHDLFKNGVGELKDRPKNITNTHGVHLAAIIAENVKEKFSISEDRILAGIAGHMGVWTEPIVCSCWNQKDEKSSNVAKIVHLSDYCAAQKVDDFVKMLSLIQIEIPKEKNSTDYSNGKSLEKTFAIDSDPYMLATILFELVNERQPNYYKKYTKLADGKEYFVQKESYYFDLLLRKDGKSIEEILRVLEWSQKSSFWQKNIKSGAKFREKYEQLLEQTEEVAEDVIGADLKITQLLMDQYIYFINNDKFVPTEAQGIKFMKASIMMMEFFNSEKYKDIEENQRMILLGGCIQKNFGDNGRILYPGSLCSEELWEILMPQFLLELGT